MIHSRWPSAADAFAQSQAQFESHGQAQGLFGSRQPNWIALTQRYLDLLQPFMVTSQCPRILLVQQNPVEFLAAFMAACIADCPIFLGNPAWSAAEWEQVGALVQPHLVWGTLSISPVPEHHNPSDRAQRGWIMIPTGGSSGDIKFVIHTWQTLSAAVLGFQSFFCEGQPIHSCCVLPLYHVSGLMQFLRSLLTGGQLVILPFADFLNRDLAHLEWAVPLLSSPQPKSYFLSLVPTQLQRLLERPSQLSWVQHEHATILLGGAPAWPALLEQGRALGLSLAPTYGMTETAAQVATLKPAEFLQGHPSTGRCLPHAQITIQSKAERASDRSEVGIITIRSESLFHGYYPKFVEHRDWETDDIGFLDAEGYLSIVGRNSRKILSGGENIFPEEVERALLATGLVQEVYVLGTPDLQWGEAVTALCVPTDPSQSELERRLKAELGQTLSRYKHPKRWIAVEERLPRNAQGKLDHKRLKQWAMDRLS